LNGIIAKLRVSKILQLQDYRGEMIPGLLFVGGMIYNATSSRMLCMCISFLHAQHLATSCNVKCVQK